MDETITRQVLDDRYVLLDQLGSGGAGAVWRAHDEVLERTVAVKLLHSELARDADTAARFRAEAAAAAKLTHPHAVIVYDIGTADSGGDYLVMELVEGGTLGDVLDQGPLPAGVAAALGAQVARALGTAHGRGLVHRDVKPANVLVTRDGVAKVADFGIARALGEATSRLTSPGQVVGTARYLAPEQLRDEEVDGRADVYALGLMLHQAVTGQLPFGEGTAAEVAARRLLVDGLPRASELAPSVPTALDDVLARATAIDPADRYVDGAAFAAALAPLAAPQAATELAARIRLVHRDTTDALPPVTPPRAAVRREATPPVGGRPTPEPTVAADYAAMGSTPPEPVGDDQRRPWLPWAAALAVLIVGLLFAWPGGPVFDLGADAPDEEQAEGNGSDAAEAAEAEPLAAQAAGDHDPFGDGSENGGSAGNAADGDEATVWQTEGYDDPLAALGKDGVGLWLDLGSSVALDRLTVTTAHPGYTMTVFAGDGPPAADQAPGDWGREVGGIDDAEATVEIPLADDAEGSAVLLWFTALGPDGSRLRGSLAEVEIHGS